MTGASFTSNDIPDLTGQVIIVTGGNVGLGYETIRQLRRHNPARIYLAARSEAKASAAIKQLQDAEPSESPISFLHLDLSSFSSIKNAAKTFMATETRLDILINNAGIMMTPEGLTEDGYEIQFGTNVLGPALFTQLLLPLVKKTAKTNPEARVVVLASASENMAPRNVYQFHELKTTIAHRNTTARYTQSKLASIHYTIGMAERHRDVKFVAVHPGMVATNLHHNSTGFFLKPFLNTAIFFATPVEKGALSQIWAAVSPDAKSGEYYSPVGVPGKGSKASKDPDLREVLFKWVQEQVEPQIDK